MQNVLQYVDSDECERSAFLEAEKSEVGILTTGCDGEFVEPRMECSVYRGHIWSHCRRSCVEWCPGTSLKTARFFHVTCVKCSQEHLPVLASVFNPIRSVVR